MLGIEKCRGIDEKKEMTMDGPLVSVTIPAYNHEPYVQEAIKSVLRQSYENLELIVIDDGSTDGTAEKIRECRRHEERIRFVSRENQGLVRTLNLGIKLAKGKYWCQMASDDFMDERNIRMKVDFLETNRDYDAVCSDSLCLHPDQTLSRMIPEKTKPDPLKVRHPRDLFQAKMFVPSLLFRKSVFDRIGGFDESLRYYEDIEMKPRLLLYCKVGYIDEPLLTWRSHGGNTSRNALLRRKEKIIAFEKLFALPEMRNHRFLRRRTLGDEYYKCGRLRVRNRLEDPEHTVSWYFRRSLLFYPFRPMAYYFFARSLFRNPSKSLK